MRVVRVKVDFCEQVFFLVHSKLRLKFCRFLVLWRDFHFFSSLIRDSKLRLKFCCFVQCFIERKINITEWKLIFVKGLSFFFVYLWFEVRSLKFYGFVYSLYTKLIFVKRFPFLIPFKILWFREFYEEKDFLYGSWFLWTDFHFFSFNCDSK